MRGWLTTPCHATRPASHNTEVQPRKKIPKPTSSTSFSHSPTLCFGHSGPLAVPSHAVGKCCTMEVRSGYSQGGKDQGHLSQLGGTTVRGHFLEEIAPELNSADWITNMRTAHICSTLTMCQAHNWCFIDMTSLNSKIFPMG